ncbi:MAG: patatin-like phospholipase family protein [Trueperaceae bacterium]
MNGSGPTWQEGGLEDGLGVALGGGTARALAHVGVLAELEAAGVRPNAYAGTSFGAIIAAMAALGTPPLEMERIARQLNVMEIWTQGVDFGLHRAALVHGERWARWLDRKMFFGARFEDTEVPLAIAVTDLADGSGVVVREGPIIDAVRASCALPGLFAVPCIRGSWHVDGGFVEPVPFAALRTLGSERMLGVHTGLDLSGSATLGRLRRLDAGPVGRWLHHRTGRLRGRNPWSRLALGLSLSLRSYRNVPVAPPGAELLTVDPPVRWWDLHRSPQAIRAGRDAARRWLADRPQVGAMMDAPA